MYYNVEAFIALIKKYRSITLRDINRIENIQKDRGVFTDYDGIARSLTGFGSSQTCSLCISARALLHAENLRAVGFCGRCCYSLLPSKNWDALPCVDIVNSTYYGICHAPSQEILFAAFRARAYYMEFNILPLVPKDYIERITSPAIPKE